MANYHVNGAAGTSGDGLSWGTAFTDLQEALDLAISGDEIFVAQGTYFPSVQWDVGTGEPFIGTDPRKVTFRIPSGVKVLGGYDASTGERDIADYETILSGDIGAGTLGDNAYHVVFFYEVNSETLLDGFTITLGFADGDEGGFSAPDNLGGGAYNNPGLSTSNPKINACTFTQNFAAYAGGAISSDEKVLIPYISGCTFNYNSSSIGGAIRARTLRINDSQFLSNIANGFLELGGGGAILIDETDLGLAIMYANNCTFTDNSTVGYGGAIALAPKEDSVISVLNSCYFNNNTSVTGGALMVQSINIDTSLSVNECIFSGNNAILGDTESFAVGGGAVTLFGNLNVSFDKCIFNDNTSAQDPNASSSGGAFLVVGSEITCFITNCLFAGNIAEGGGGAIQSFAIPNEEEEEPGEINITVINTTFYNNLASSGGDVIDNNLSFDPTGIINLEISNSILWSDVPGTYEAVGGETSNTTVSYSDILGGWIGAGTNNFDLDPQFVNPSDPIGPDGIWATEDDGLILSSTSPLVIAGTIIGAPGTDIVGITRSNPPTIGAYETYVLNTICKKSSCANFNLCGNGTASESSVVLFTVSPFTDTYVNAYLAVQNNTNGIITVSGGVITPTNILLPGEASVLTITNAFSIGIDILASAGTYTYTLAINANLPLPTIN